MRLSGNRYVGSNPTISATGCLQTLRLRAFSFLEKLTFSMHFSLGKYVARRRFFFGVSQNPCVYWIPRDREVRNVISQYRSKISDQASFSSLFKSSETPSLLAFQGHEKSESGRSKCRSKAKDEEIFAEKSRWV